MFLHLYPDLGIHIFLPRKTRVTNNWDYSNDFRIGMSQPRKKKLSETNYPWQFLWIFLLILHFKMKNVKLKKILWDFFPTFKEPIFYD